LRASTFAGAVRSWGGCQSVAAPPFFPRIAFPHRAAGRSSRARRAHADARLELSAAFTLRSDAASAGTPIRLMYITKACMACCLLHRPARADIERGQAAQGLKGACSDHGISA